MLGTFPPTFFPHDAEPRAREKRYLERVKKLVFGPLSTMYIIENTEHQNR